MRAGKPSIRSNLLAVLCAFDSVAEALKIVGRSVGELEEFREQVLDAVELNAEPAGLEVDVRGQGGDLVGVTSRNGKNRTLRPIERRAGPELALFNLLVQPPAMVQSIVGKELIGWDMLELAFRVRVEAAYPDVADARCTRAGVARLLRELAERRESCYRFQKMFPSFLVVTTLRVSRPEGVENNSPEAC